MDGKQMTAVFYDENRNLIKPFMLVLKDIDFTVAPHDKEKRKQYTSRHRSNENWNDPMTAGTLSRYILWEYPSLSMAINQKVKRFK